MTNGGNTKAGDGGSPPRDDGERRASTRLAAKRQTKQRAREEGKQRYAAAAAAVAQAAAAAAGAAVGVGDGGRRSTDSSQGQQPQLQQPPNAVFVIAGSKPQHQPQQQQQGQEQPQPQPQQQQHQGQQQPPSAAVGTAVAIATGLSESLAAVAAAPAAAAARVRRPSYELECGLWGLLPEEVRANAGVGAGWQACGRASNARTTMHASPSGCLAPQSATPPHPPTPTPTQLLEIILRQCEAQQLGMLESSCCFFHGNRTLERIARSKLKAIPRARGLKPNKE